MVHYVFDILLNFWTVLAMMAPYLLLGVPHGGTFVGAGLAVRWTSLWRRGLWPVVKAALLGMPIPLCSCAVIPVSASLECARASKGATISFLISTPETGVDGIAATWGMMGGIFAVCRVVVALISGVLGGLAVVLFDKPETAGSPGESGNSCTASCCATEAGRRPGVLRRMFEYGFVDLPRDIGKSLLVGLAVAAVIALVPGGYFQHSILGGGIVAMIAMACLAGPVYVCATAFVPMALMFVTTGVSPGAVLVFLMVGPATNAATLAMVWKVMGKRTAVIYLVSVIGCAIAAGLALDALFQTFAWPLPTMAAEHNQALTLLHDVSAAGLLGLLAYGALAAGQGQVRHARGVPDAHPAGPRCRHDLPPLRRSGP